MAAGGVYKCSFRGKDVAAEIVTVELEGYAGANGAVFFTLKNDNGKYMSVKSSGGSYEFHSRTDKKAAEDSENFTIENLNEHEMVGNLIKTLLPDDAASQATTDASALECNPGSCVT